MIAKDIHPDDKLGYVKKPRKPSAFDDKCGAKRMKEPTFPASYNSISLNSFRERCRLAGWNEQQIAAHLASFYK